jgi:hypothetical protein
MKMDREVHFYLFEDGFGIESFEVLPPSEPGIFSDYIKRSAWLIPGGESPVSPTKCFIDLVYFFCE